MPRVAFNFLLLNPCYLYLLSNLAIRCVNDCLRVSEEKEVLSDGAGAGSRFVARGWAEWIWRGLMQIFDDAMTRSSRPYDHLYMTIDHPHTGWYFLLSVRPLELFWWELLDNLKNKIVSDTVGRQDWHCIYNIDRPWKFYNSFLHSRPLLMLYIWPPRRPYMTIYMTMTNYLKIKDRK